VNGLDVAIAVIVFLLSPVWFVASAIVCIVVVLGIYLRAAWRACRPSARLSAGAIPPDSSERDPAYLSYLAREVFLDALNTVRAAWVDVKAAAQDASATASRVLIGNRKNSPLITSLLGLGTGALLAAGFVTAGLAIAAAIFAGTLVVAGAVIITLFVTLGGAERLLILARGIRVSCPHDGGCRHFGLPAYACDGVNCDERHSQLSPNRNGVLRHVCRCGTRLPTATVLGRYRLVAYCPSCDRPLPGRIGTVPIDHIALVGESGYGKSTLMYLLLSSLQKRTINSHGALAFVNHWDLENLNAGLDRLRRGDRLSPTMNRLPHALMVDVRGAADPGRILYLFDPAGEVYRKQRGVQSQQYLQDAEYLIILIDPFALPEVRSKLTLSDLERAIDRDPSAAVDDRRDPAEIIDDLAATVLHSGRLGRVRRIAVVITKVDALRETTVGERLGRSPDDRRAWLERLGLSPTLEVLNGFGTEVKFFASGLGGISGSGQAEPGQEEILEWCATPGSVAARRLSRFFSRLVGSNARKPRRSTGKKRKIPSSYQVGRLILLAGQVAAVATVPLLVLAFIDWLGF
jgi:double-GTPase-like protein